MITHSKRIYSVTIDSDNVLVSRESSFADGDTVLGTSYEESMYNHKSPIVEVRGDMLSISGTFEAGSDIHFHVGDEAVHYTSAALESNEQVAQKIEAMVSASGEYFTDYKSIDNGDGGYDTGLTFFKIPAEDTVTEPDPIPALTITSLVVALISVDIPDDVKAFIQGAL